MSADIEPSFLVADIGKTSCRARLVLPGGNTFDKTGPGTVGLAHPKGESAVVAALRGALGSDLASRAVGALACVATAGQLAPVQGMALAQRLLTDLQLQACAVTSDAVAAHVGALGGHPGTVLAMGTGVAAFGVSAGGELHLVDGVGQWLGDEGSGAWIGLEGLRAVVRARDGRGPATLLTDAATDVYGDLDLLPLTLERSGNVPQVAARFAPRVAALAGSDETAAGVLQGAAERLAESAITAARLTGTADLAVVGGLVGLGPALLDPWCAAVTAAGLRVVEPQGSALDGAARLCRDSSLPHEPLVCRVQSSGR